MYSTSQQIHAPQQLASSSTDLNHRQESPTTNDQITRTQNEKYSSDQMSMQHRINSNNQSIVQVHPI